MAGAERARRFHDRYEAGRRLAGELHAYAGRDDVIVVALPRGGVPVGYEVARALGLPLEVMQVRKLGVPGHEELAMGAIASGGVRIVSENVVEALGIPERVIATVAAAEVQELERRERVYREGRLFPEMRGRTVTVAPKESRDAMREVVDEVVCASVPERFQAVGEWYDDFSQISDQEVSELLRRGRHEAGR